MPYDSVIRNIQNRHKRIKHMNTFIIAMFPGKLRKCSENPVSESRVSAPSFRVLGLRSQIPPLRWVPSLKSYSARIVTNSSTLAISKMFFADDKFSVVSIFVTKCSKPINLKTFIYASRKMSPFVIQKVNGHGNLLICDALRGLEPFVQF